MLITKVTIRGRVQRDIFDEDLMLVIEVPDSAHCHVNDQGTVHIGYNAVWIEADDKAGVSAGWKYSRSITIPGWRVLMVETTY